MKKIIYVTIVMCVSLISVPERVKLETGVTPLPGMVYVPAGQFLMGSEMYQNDEKPSHKVTLKAFFIDINEVTFAEYLKCPGCHRPRFGKAAGKNWPKMQPNWPVVGINWEDADKYCRWKKKRLPTEAEWEKAARGNSGNPYPWGDELDCRHANYVKCGIGHPVDVGSYPPGRSPYGALDMAGNAQEWVADWYDPMYYKNAPNADPPGPATGTKKVLRGGSFDYASQALRTSYRYADYSKNDDTSYGFRCAASP